MVKRNSTRKSNKGLFGRVYSPLKHLLSATRNVSKSVFSRSGRVVNQGLGLVENAGSAVARHANMTVSNIAGKPLKRSRKEKKSRKNSRKEKKSRK